MRTYVHPSELVYACTHVRRKMTIVYVTENTAEGEVDQTNEKD